VRPSKEERKRPFAFRSRRSGGADILNKARGDILVIFECSFVGEVVSQPELEQSGALIVMVQTTLPDDDQVVAAVVLDDLDAAKSLLSALKSGDRVRVTGELVSLEADEERMGMMIDATDIRKA
jgi:hypothetical protein